MYANFIQLTFVNTSNLHGWITKKHVFRYIVSLLYKVKYTKVLNINILHYHEHGIYNVMNTEHGKKRKKNKGAHHENTDTIYMLRPKISV